ncbi:MAG: class I SAM-dependent methyltransferase [Desulfovibrionaceae bacterium]|nr:class I SAM-dependent methyltransferase [Desulfovibrionaceae bacterium]MBF0514804.1 class I SAM-dependent methyltransferase [Desulfovibrionaceae bacterium]
MRGSGEHVRAPLVYPFVRLDDFNFQEGGRAAHLLPGIDWLVLGGDPEKLSRLALEAARALSTAGRPATVRVAPFVSIAGGLPQEREPGDTVFEFRKSAENFNQADWLQNAALLTSLPEDRWADAGVANTVDQFEVLAPVLERYLPRPPRVIVDLGCGLGQTARSLARRYPDARVLGLDSSAEAIKAAQSVFRLPNLSFGLADLSRPLDLAPGAIDCLVSVNALPYAQDQLGAARELFSLLSPDGLLLNLCRAEESHQLYDFPRGLLLPTNTQLFVSDWARAAGRAGLGTKLWGAPMGLSSSFYTAKPFEVFASALDAYARAHRHDGFGGYACSCSHVLLVHGARVPRTALPAVARQDNHLLRLDLILGGAARLPKELQRAAIAAWLGNARGLDLYNEALDFMAALLPRSAPLLRAALGPLLEAQPAAM